MAMQEKKYPNIVVEPPGPKARKIVEDDKKLISPSYGHWYPMAVDSGQGSIIRDVDGNEYIDFNSGLVVMNVGMCHPKVVEAITRQTRKMMHYSLTDFYYSEAVELARALNEITPGAFPKKVHFGNSGAEAVEGAIKLARWHTKRPRILAFIKGFHGRTMGAVSLTSSKPVQMRHFFPLVPGVTHVPYPNCYRCPFKLDYPGCDMWCVDFIEEYLLKTYVPPEETAAIIFEPIQGEGGYIVPPKEYFPRLKKLMDKYGILMIDDEVQSGMGRAGKWFAIEHLGIEPDIICVGKGIASGLPLSATVAKASVMDWERGAHASTFGGNPIACKAALAVIDAMKSENMLDNANKQGGHIQKRFREMQKKYEMIGDVRGHGLMIGVELIKDKKTKAPAKEGAESVMNHAWKKGVLLITAGASTLRIAPPLNITRDLVDSALDIIEECVKKENHNRK